jgi:hypothetical protein
MSSDAARVSARTFTHKIQTPSITHAHTTHDTRTHTHVTRSNQLPSPPATLADRSPPLCPHPKMRFNSVSDHHAAFTRCFRRIPRYHLCFLSSSLLDTPTTVQPPPNAGVMTHRESSYVYEHSLRCVSLPSLPTSDFPHPHTRTRTNTARSSPSPRFPSAPLSELFTSTASQDGLTSLVCLHGALALLDARSKVAGGRSWNPLRFAFPTTLTDQPVAPLPPVCLLLYSRCDLFRL